MVVVGGGAAGLSGALVLARARRSVLVIDAGEPRNAPADGRARLPDPRRDAAAELARIGRAEVGRLRRRARATGAATSARQDGRRLHGDPRRRRAPSRPAGCWSPPAWSTSCPTSPGCGERWGRDVLHCPYCHGWEVRDQAIGVLATGPVAVHQALLFRQWTADVTLLLHTQPSPTEDQLEQLAARDIRVVAGRGRRPWRRRPAPGLANGDAGPAPTALAVAPRFVARSELLSHPRPGVPRPNPHRRVHRRRPHRAHRRPRRLGRRQRRRPHGPGRQPRRPPAPLAAAAINADLITEDVERAVNDRRSLLPR